MKNNIFTTPRRGLMGNKPLGANYMANITERARRMKAAAAIRKQGKRTMTTEDRQLNLPGFGVR